MPTSETKSQPVSQNMTAAERRVAMALSAVFATRMLGLFMVLPVFAEYASTLEGYSKSMAGLALGAYALMQSLLQIPLGALSDRIGRKPIILGGLAVFALGSLVAAMSDSLMGVLIGRALQGTGAIASTVMALAADLTREEHRMKVMAAIGMSIGVAFSLAIVLAPLLAGLFGLSGIFWLTMILALLGMLVVIFFVPTPVTTRFHRDTQVDMGSMRKVFANRQLLRLDFGVFVLHFVMTATFFALPLVWKYVHQFSVADHWLVYLPAMLGSAILVLPFIIVGEARRLLKPIFIFAVGLIAVVSFGLWWTEEWWVTVAMLSLFFIGFNLLEASLPSLVAKYSPPAQKGTAMGAYSTAQFLGAFLGATVAGLVSDYFSDNAIFLVNGILLLAWFLVTLTMRQPPYLSSELLNIGELSESEAQKLATKLTQVRGVAEVVIIPGEGVAYLKVDKKALDREAIYDYSV